MKPVRRSFALCPLPFALTVIALWLAVILSVGLSAQSAVQGVTEFTVNGLRVLVKQRPTSQTVAAGLFIKGGARNITAANAGTIGTGLTPTSGNTMLRK